MGQISYGRQYVDTSDIDAVAKVLESAWITQGPRIDQFEKSLAAFCGAEYAVAVSSGTAALHLASLAAGLRKGDEAITTPITFLATANSIIYAGAKPIFADIEHETANIDPERIKEKITKKTKAVLPVHFAGLPCNMVKIEKIARENGLRVIEDASHALGAEYKSAGKWVKVGSCDNSDMTAFSFHPVKHITTGEGGAITTNNIAYYNHLRALRNHGIYKNRKMLKRGQWYYEMRELGFNYRMTDLQAALGISQLRKLRGFLRRRREIASIYDKAFENIDGIKIIRAKKNLRHAYHLYVLKIDYKKFGIDRTGFFSHLNKDGISPQVHYIPLYRQPYYKKMYKKGLAGFGMSEAYYREAVSIPLYPSMSMADVRRVIDVIKKVLSV